MQRIQTNITTQLYRELDALTAAKRVLPTDRTLNILSFGCSIGDELATLKILFPRARIQGCDVDPFALGKADATVGHFAEVFFSSDENIAQRGPYDLICAFSSLCVNPLPSLDKFKELLPFSLFEDRIGMLDGNLRTGGLLAVKNSSYSFGATGVAENYTTIRSQQIVQSGFIPVFNKSGALALAAINTPCGPVHEARDVAGMADWDFIDSVFQKRDSQSAAAPRLVRLDDGYGVTKFPGQGGFISWTRSNLDAMDEADRNGYLIEITRTYRLASAPADGSFPIPASAVLECDVWRSSLNGGERIAINVCAR